MSQKTNTSQTHPWRRFQYALLLLLLAICLAWPGASAHAQTPPSPVTVVDASPEHTLLELTVSDYAIEEIVLAGETYQRIHIPGLEQQMQPGRPQAPVTGVLVGIPGTDDVRLEIVETEYRTLSGVRLPPAPRFTLTSSDPFALTPDEEPQTVYAMDQNLETRDEWLPGPIAQAGETGMLRDQAVVRIQFFPVQYNPRRQEVRIYQRIRVAVRADRQSPDQREEASRRLASPLFERLLQQTLVNYGALDRPQSVLMQEDGLYEDNARKRQTGDAGQVKIGVEEDGVYRVDYADLAAAGLDMDAIDPHKLRLVNRGVSIPIQVVGEADGAFDPSDFILFYGQGNRDVYTARNVYWLSVGPENGLRMQQRDVTPAGALVAGPFPWSVHAEEDTVYWQWMPDGEGQDHYFWDSVLSPNTEGWPTTREITIPLTNVVTSTENARIRVQLKGFSSLEHRTRIYLNDALVHEQDWEGQGFIDLEAPIPQSRLINGDNVVRVETVNIDVVPDQILLNWVEVDYAATYTANADELRFAPPGDGEYRFDLTGFDREEMALFDISEPQAPIALTGLDVIPQGGGYQASFQDAAQGDSRYLALTPDRYRTPASLELDTPSNWRSPDHGADYILITHPDFLDEAQRLADFRVSQGLRVAVVRVDDLYDEFNGGVFNPGAIRDFIAYALDNWQAPAPAYVTLFGDAYQDYRDNLGTGTRNYVPAQVIESNIFGQVPSDNWYVAVHGDDFLPDLFVGRLSAKTADQAAAIVDKLIAYDANPPDVSWNSRVTMVTDDDSPAFAALSESLLAETPFYYDRQRLDAADYPPDDPTKDLTADIRRAFDDGSILLNYTGHGSTIRWGINASADIFTREDAAALQPSDRPAFVTVANCLNGFFTGPIGYDSLTEVLQRQPRGGAIAALAPSDRNFTSGHRVVLSSLYRALFQDDVWNLGAAVTAAKLDAYARAPGFGDLVQTYIFLGDPYTRLGVPANYPYVERVEPAGGEVVDAPDRPIAITFSKPVRPETVAVSVTITTADKEQVPVDLHLTPAWNQDHTAVTYAHDDFAANATYRLSVQARDKNDLPLGEGPTPRKWSFTSHFRIYLYLPAVTNGE